jgi:glycerol-3-phosphate cytidylyltransferase
MKRVITYGTFDLFHYGHLRILERAKQLGDYLIVGVSTEAFNRIKNKECVYPYEQRAQIVAAIKHVDLVIPEETWEQKKSDIKKYKVDILVMGDDWQGKFDELSKICKVVYLARTPDVSSTAIKKNCHDHVKKGL